MLATMDPAPLVSVIIILLNTECFIEETVLRDFAQAYRHWELLLVVSSPQQGAITSNAR
jgi:glycosyltransferase involved in cell wall biosynthesis